MSPSAEAALRRGKGILLPTPEGVPLRIPLAEPGDRAVALLLDGLLAILILLLLTLAILAVPGDLTGAQIVLFFVLSFLIRQFYFMGSEAWGRGSTLGKRARGLRVVDVDGGPLQARAIVVRNLMRELDLFLPLGLVPTVQQIWPEAPAWMLGLVVAWMLALFLLPVFEPRRRRLGDLVAGTLVVSIPRPELLPDLAVAPPKTDAPGATPDYAFSREQLALYGIYELQVLENVLRQDEGPSALQARATVSETIRAKIRWEGGRVRDRAFLTAFYRALRADLERRMLLGDRREDKHAGEGPSTRTPPPDR